MSAVPPAACAQPTGPTPIAVTPPQEPLTLDAAFDRAIQANPTLAAARLAEPLARARIGVARERPNPEAHIEFERETPTRAYGVALPLELGGKRARRVAVGEAELRTSTAQVTQALVEVRASVRQAYFNVVAATAKQALLDELRDIAVRARDAAQQRFDAGASPRLEVLEAELALAQAENERNTAGAETTAARAALNALLALPLNAATPLATALDEGAAPTLDEAMARVRAENAEVAVIDRRIDEQRARIALAQAMQVPDITPEAAITRNAAPEFDTGWRAGLTLAVPIFTRHRAGVDVEQAALRQLEAERSATVAKVSGDVAAAVTLADARRLQYLRYRDQILPRAVEVERMAEDSYRLGQTGLAALLQALQTTRDLRLRALQAGADYQSARASLERAIGAPLP